MTARILPAALLAAVLLAGCGSGAGPLTGPVTTPPIASPSPTPSAGAPEDLCRLVEDVTVRSHLTSFVATGRYEGQIAAEQAWHDALRALAAGVTDPPAREAATTLTEASTTVSDQGWDTRFTEASGRLDAFALRECGFGASSYRPRPFAGLRLPARRDPAAQPASVLVSDGRRVEVVDPESGRTLGTVADALGEGFDRVALDRAGGSAYFAEEFGTFAGPAWSGIWRVPLAGGEYELVALERGLLGSLDVSPDGRYVAYSHGDDLVVHDADFGTSSRVRRRGGGVWLADSRRLAVPATRSGVHGIEIVTTDLEPGRFHPVARRGAWASLPVTSRSSDGALLVTEACCFSPDGTPREGSDGSAQLYLDPDDGRALGRADHGRDRAVVDLDATGRHPLLAGEPETACDHVCGSVLYRLAGGTPVPIRPGIVSAAWS